jgi:hypothetical protein
MNRVLMLAPVFLLIPMAVAAQGATAPPRQKPIMHEPNRLETCPVVLFAWQKADGEMIEVGESRPKGPAQRLHLTVEYPASKAITRARITVHGFIAKARVAPTPARSGSPAEASRTLDVVFRADSKGDSASADLWVPGLTAVRTIDLDAVTFADGSSRSLVGRVACSIVPDPLMLIAGH